jgi:uncharacterized membrane protein
MHYFPLALPFFLALFLFFGFIVFLIEVHVLQYAYEKVGVDRRHMFVLIFLSFLGSYVNIPVAHLPPTQVVSHEVINFFGIPYVIPEVVAWPGTVIAVNIGGAAIPVILSFYLIVKNGLYLRGLLTVGVVTLIVHRRAYPVPGVGIATPTFIPPLATAIAALVISWRHAAPLAYIGGSLGTLIGADLLNLDKVQGLGAPVASIGGAGKFDGIFLTGVIAVLLADIVSRKSPFSGPVNEAPPFR